MVVLTALAALGVYQGGKAVTEDIGKRARRRTTERGRVQERKEMASERQRQRQQELETTQNMTVDERLQRFKQNVPQKKQRNGLFGRSK